jgi:hypothetical protein
VLDPGRHLRGKAKSPFVNMSRVTERPSGEADKRVPDGFPIREVAVTKPAKADQIADRCRPEHQLYRHGAATSALSAAALPHGVG